jgi:hypothetical protein
LAELRRFWMFQYKYSMKPGTLQYGSCPQLEKRLRDESSEERALRHLTSKYDSYHGLLLQQQNQRHVSSLDGSETATDVSSSSSSSTAEERLQVTDEERLQVETFFRGLKTQVCSVPTPIFLKVIKDKPDLSSERAVPLRQDIDFEREKKKNWSQVSKRSQLSDRMSVVM